MERINKSIFMEHFKKGTWTKNTYIVSELTRRNGDVIADQFTLQNRIHAESQCITRLKQTISVDEVVSLTWYISWTPCNVCADEIIAFLHQYPNVTLQIHAARVYYHENQLMREGLRRLRDNNVAISIMGWRDYVSLWQTYGDSTEEIRRNEVYEGNPLDFEDILTTILQ
ncbi:DNA dC-_dU-editing enzyme APOBEC-3D-like isoform X2 [Protopterus annectens]|nr:DNA dC->dU-editing enzyme APOBEC-3D-like isoform X2 [Protopterus annectens]